MDRGLASGSRAWLAEAVTVLRRALDDSPPAAVERTLHLNNLAEALRCWYETVGDPAAADEAAVLLRAAMAVPQGDRGGTDLAGVNLGALLINRALLEADPRLADEAGGSSKTRSPGSGRAIRRVLTPCRNSPPPG